MLTSLKKHLTKKLTPIFKRTKPLLDLVRQFQIEVSEAQLTKAAAKASGVSSIMVSIHRTVQIHVGLGEACTLLFEIEPIRIAWSTQGAKELFFKISPEELATHPVVMDVTSKIAGALADTFFSFGLRNTEHASSTPFAEKEPHGILRFDIRSPNAMRTQNSASILPFNFLRMEKILLHEGALKIQIAKPLPFSPR